MYECVKDCNMQFLSPAKASLENIGHRYGEIECFFGGDGGANKCWVLLQELKQRKACPQHR